MKTLNKAQYRAFKRTWWRHNPNWPNGLEPYAGRKIFLGKFLTEEGARDFCRQWNSSHEPGKLSLKAEYEII